MERVTCTALMYFVVAMLLFQLLELNIVQILYRVSNLSTSAIINRLFLPLNTIRLKRTVYSERPAPLAIYEQIDYCILKFLEFVCKYFVIQNIEIL